MSDEQPVTEWTGTVVDYGGGQFKVRVDRDTMQYPDNGTRVRVTVLAPEDERLPVNYLSMDELRICVVALCDIVQDVIIGTMRDHGTKNTLLQYVRHTRSRVLGNT